MRVSIARVLRWWGKDSLLHRRRSTPDVALALGLVVALNVPKVCAESFDDGLEMPDRLLFVEQKVVIQQQKELLLHKVDFVDVE